MKKAGYQVVAQFPVCVDFDDGTSVSFQRGQTFLGDGRNPQIARLLRVGSIRQMGAGETPPTEIKIGLSDGDESIMKVREERKAQLQVGSSTVAKPTTQRKGEVVPASTIKPEKK